MEQTGCGRCSRRSRRAARTVLLRLARRALRRRPHAAVAAATTSGIGQIWTYTLKEGVWVPDAKTIADPLKTKPSYDPEKAGFEFGNALALDGDGGLALVADEPQDAVVLYDRVGAEWQQMNVLSDNKSSEQSEYGIAVAMSGSGNEALVSAPGGETVYSYFESGNAWHEGGNFKYFAYDGQHNVPVAISREGTTAISGEYLSGFARVWIRKGSEWEQQAELTEPKGAGEEEFGSDVVAVGLRIEGVDPRLRRRRHRRLRVHAHGIDLEPAGQRNHDAHQLLWPQHRVHPRSGAVTRRTHRAAVVEVLSEPGLYTDTPALATGAPGELTTTSVTLKGTVNPAGETPTSCRFEYGTSTAYGSVKACSPLPEGLALVPVSGAVSGLSSGKTYHFRLQVISPAGTFYSSDATFTTVTALATAKTEEPSKPATATLGSVSATASEGTGTVAVGSYGTNVGEPTLPSSTGGYLDVYRSSTASFTQVEIKACEIGNAKALWAYGKEGWEPVEPAATVSSGCLVFTATPTSRPSVSELEGFRYKMGEPAGQFGECRAAKKSVYAESACLHVHESKGHADGKGKYKWYPSEAGEGSAQKKASSRKQPANRAMRRRARPREVRTRQRRLHGRGRQDGARSGRRKDRMQQWHGAPGELSSPEREARRSRSRAVPRKRRAAAPRVAAGTIVSFPLEVIVLQSAGSRGVRTGTRGRAVRELLLRRDRLHDRGRDGRTAHGCRQRDERLHPGVLHERRLAVDRPLRA